MSQVTHPSHYNTGKFEVIEIIEDQQLGFHLGNAVKYLCRAGRKDPSKTVEDLRKAIWYVERFIEIYQSTNPRRPNEMNHREPTCLAKGCDQEQQDNATMCSKHLEAFNGGCVECGVVRETGTAYCRDHCVQIFKEPK